MTRKRPHETPVKPRFAIEATNLADTHATGVGRYTRCLIEALSALDLPAGDEFDLVQVYKASRQPRREAMASGPRLGLQAWRGRIWPLRKPTYDLIHVPDERMPPWPMAMVATIHDLYAALRINYTDEAKRQRKLRHYETMRDRCARLICVSEHTRQDFLRHVGGDPARIRVVHLGVAERFRPHGNDELAPFRRRHGLEDPYLLFIGTTANKNLARMLEAFAASSARHDYRLVIAGKLPQAALATVQARIDALGMVDRVHLPGYVDDADLAPLYAGAGAFLFPSLYEGYGLPILEAMASGTPVLTSDRASCTEVAAGHAVIANPEDIAALASGLDETLAMSAARRDAARAHAATKTWARTARETLAIWNEVVAGG
jgi:glycosyltransferase involved in cell wall biosynthesis